MFHEKIRCLKERVNIATGPRSELERLRLNLSSLLAEGESGGNVIFSRSYETWPRGSGIRLRSLPLLPSRPSI
jgi:hypothetical protein